MVKKAGIPKEILRELDVNEQEKEHDLFVSPVVESHQIKLPIPSQIRLEVNISKGKKIKVDYDKKNKRIIYQL